MSDSPASMRKPGQIRKMQKASGRNGSPRTSRAHSSRRQSMLILDLQGRKKDILRQILDVRNRLSKLDDVEVEQTVAQLSPSTGEKVKFKAQSASATSPLGPSGLGGVAEDEEGDGDGDASPTFSPMGGSLGLGLGESTSKPGSSAEAMYQNQRKYNKGLESLKITRDGQLDEIRSLKARLQGEHETIQQEKLQQNFIHALDTPMQTAIYTLTDLITDLSNRGAAADTAIADQLSTCLKTLTAANPYLPAFDFSRPEQIEMTTEKLKWLRTFHRSSNDTAGDDDDDSSTADKKEEEADKADADRADADRAAVEPVAGTPTLRDESDKVLVGSLGFDCLALEEDVLHSKWLPAIFDQTGLLQTFKVPRATFLNFLAEARRGYRPNPYHNYRHAFDVTQMTYSLLSHTNASAKLKPIEIFALLLTSLTHDIDHGGKTNDYLVNNMSPLALLYNHRSVNENHHCCHTFKLLSQPDTNVLAAIPPNQWREVRKMMVSCFLATDMSQHFEIVNRFSLRVQGGGDSFTVENKEDSLLLMNVMLHASDLSNVCRPLGIARSWANDILQEWYGQGDMERRLGLPESPLCKRPTGDKWVAIATIQTGFIDHVVSPMIKHVCKGLGPIGTEGKVGPDVEWLGTEITKSLASNRAWWGEVKEQGSSHKDLAGTEAVAADSAAEPAAEPEVEAASTAAALASAPENATKSAAEEDEDDLE